MTQYSNEIHEVILYISFI